MLPLYTVSKASESLEKTSLNYLLFVHLLPLVALFLFDDLLLFQFVY